MKRRLQKDVDDVIMKALLSGSKDASNLKQSVMTETRVSERVYHIHLKKLLGLGSIEEIAEKGNSGRLIIKYAIKLKELTKPKARFISDIELEGLRNKRTLELAAWIKRNPTGCMSDLDDVRKAKLCLEHYTYLVPSVEESQEDPDRYVPVWPQEALEEVGLQETVSSRFFDL